MQNTGTFPLPGEAWAEPVSAVTIFSPPIIIDPYTSAANDLDVMIDSVLRAAESVDPEELAVRNGLTATISTITSIAKKHFESRVVIAQVCDVEDGENGCFTPRLVLTMTLTSAPGETPLDMYRRYDALTAEIADLMSSAIRESLEVEFVFN